MQNKMIATVLFAIGTILISVFYGLRWFKGDKAKSLGYDGQWPPANRINFCPDYFTMMKDSDSHNTSGYVCVDRVGFANPERLRQYDDSTGAPDFKRITTVGTYTIGNDIVNAISGAVLDTLERKCQICQDLGVTWEGIYDGQSCIGLGKRTVDSSTSGTTTCPPT